VTDSLDRFRTRARTWLEGHARPSVDSHSGRRDPGQRAAAVARAREFQRQLFDADLAALCWPVAYGGQGLPSVFQQAFNEESADFQLPVGPLTVGLGMCGPTLLAVGTEEQRTRFVPPLVRGEALWCQLFSEPGAGSDLASVSTVARRDAGAWVLSGQKVWTSGGHDADWGAALARTDPDVPKHAGITMFIVDMSAPGVTVRPLRQMNGEADFDEVFLDEVRVPDAHVLGGIDQGWPAALTMLTSERVAVAGVGAGIGRRGLGVESLITLARTRSKTADPIGRQRLADLYVHEAALSYLEARLREGALASAAGSLAKLVTARLAKDLSSSGVDLLGPAGVAGDAGDGPGGAEWVRLLLSAPSYSIGGGTDEIQKNVVGERVLGLPREPQADRNMPFRDVPAGR
jgi:alkylation response protein AidB-like acyl-CoA dehydrogenase